MPTAVDTESGQLLEEELAGLDNLELSPPPEFSLGRRVWRATWPKVGAVLIAVGIWQVLFWSGWKSPYVLPAPATVFEQFWESLKTGEYTEALSVTMQRAFLGYAIALVVGLLIGALVSQVRVLRVALESLITGLQTMPSIVWFPLAILFFGLNEQAIMFVVVLGAAPSIANGLIAGTDNIPPILRRAGWVLGARGVRMYTNVIFPASIPSLVGGLKQGWAFAWRSLMAGELLVTMGVQSVGFRLAEARAVNNAADLMATMILILIIGIVVDSLLFGSLTKWVRRRWGLLDPAA